MEVSLERYGTCVRRGAIGRRRLLYNDTSIIQANTDPWQVARTATVKGKNPSKNLETLVSYGIQT